MSAPSFVIHFTVPDTLKVEASAVIAASARVLPSEVIGVYFGVSRIDFMIDRKTGNIYLNEINTIPGSLSFYLWEPLGTPYMQLLDKMIDFAMKRQREKENITFSFDTNILSGVTLGRGTKGGKLNG